MSVGKGSLKRAATATATAPKNTGLAKNNEVVELEISSLKFKKEKENAAMLASVKAFGVLLPIVVVKDGDNLKVIDGAKRLTALCELGVKTVKAVVSESDGKKLSAELKKFKDDKKTVEKFDIHEEKFNAVKALGDDLPVYLL